MSQRFRQYPRRLGPRLAGLAQRFLFRRQDHVAWWLLSWPLFALSLLYRMTIAVLRRIPVVPLRLPCPVVCVGNLTVGGSGKTPVVHWLATRLHDQGHRVAVVGHGYGGAPGTHIVYDGRRILVESEVCGDEAMMLARRLLGQPIPVVAGRRRAECARLAYMEFKPDVVVLDGGFQHRELHKDLEILVVNGRNPWGTGQLLPFGPLREPLGRAKRAQAIWVNKWRYEAAPPFVATLAPDALTVFSDYRAVGLRRHAADDITPLSAIGGRRAIAFAGIADPQAFEMLLDGLDVALVATQWYPDHHPYTTADVLELQRLLALHDVDLALTTEKDLVRLPAMTEVAAVVVELVPHGAVDALTEQVSR